MKAFLAYRHTGESPEVLEDLLTRTRDSLGKVGVEAYCTFFDEAEFQDKSLSARQIMEHAFSVIDQSDLLFVLQTSENKSEGMILEVGYCLAKNIPIVVATKTDVEHTYLPEMATKTLSWANVEELQQQIADNDFSNFSR